MSVKRVGPNRDESYYCGSIEEIRIDETEEKSVVESESKEKIGNTINQLDLLHRLLSSYLPLILSYAPPCRPLRPSQEKYADMRQAHDSHHHLSCPVSARD